MVRIKTFKSAESYEDVLLSLGESNVYRLVLLFKSKNVENTDTLMSVERSGAIKRFWLSRHHCSNESIKRTARGKITEKFQRSLTN